MDLDKGIDAGLPLLDARAAGLQQLARRDGAGLGERKKGGIAHLHFCMARRKPVGVASNSSLASSGSAALASSMAW